MKNRSSKSSSKNSPPIKPQSENPCTFSVLRFVLPALAIVSIYVSLPFVLDTLNWKFDFIWIFVYVITGIGIAYFLRVIYYFYKSCKEERRELSSIIFVIIVGLTISILLTVHFEYVPQRYTQFIDDSDDMSVSVDYIYPLILPIRTLSDPIENQTRVTINNDSNTQIESVKLVSPINSVISSSQSEFEPKKSNGKLVYVGNFSAANVGEIFNKTDEYKIAISYLKLPERTIAPTGTDSSCNMELPIHNVTASSNQTNYPASLAIDKINTTRWTNNGSSWIILDLASQNNICSVNILWFKGNERQYIFDISVSNDSIKFTKILTGGSDDRSMVPGEYNVNDTNGRYVKVTANGSNVSSWVSINETSIFGKDMENKTRVYHNLVTFPWNIQSLDLNLMTYFWVVLAGVVASRFLDFILRVLGPEDEIKKKIYEEQQELIKLEHPIKGDKDDAKYDEEKKIYEEKIEGHEKKLRELLKRNTDFKNKILQNLYWKDLLWIVFSFMVAVLVFSSFKQSVTLSTFILINISLAFGFGFTFDRTLEMATRFKSIFTSGNET